MSTVDYTKQFEHVPPKGHVHAGWGLWHDDGTWTLIPAANVSPAVDTKQTDKMWRRGWTPVWAATPAR